MNPLLGRPISGTPEPVFDPPGDVDRPSGEAGHDLKSTCAHFSSRFHKGLAGSVHPAPAARARRKEGIRAVRKSTGPVLQTVHGTLANPTLQETVLRQARSLGFGSLLRGRLGGPSGAPARRLRLGAARGARARLSRTGLVMSRPRDLGPRSPLRNPSPPLFRKQH